MPNHLSFALLVAASAEVRDIKRAEMWLQRHFPQFQCKHHNLVGNLCNQMGVSKNTGTPKWMVYNGKPYEQMDDLGIALFLETPKSWHVEFFFPGLHARIWIQRFSNIRKWFKACWRLALGALVELIQFHPLTRFCPAWRDSLEVTFLARL